MKYLLLFLLCTNTVLADHLRITYTRPDGGTSVVIPTPKYLAGFADETAAIEAMKDDVIPEGATGVSVIDKTALPADREFRNAWRQNAGRVEVNLEAARAIKAERMERARREEMRELLLREELGENVTLDKSRLRGVDPAALTSGASSVDELKAICPPPLENRLEC